MRKSTYYSIYHFIGKLTEGQETIVSSDVCNKLDALILLKVEYELHNLPEIKLCKFSRAPSKWPKFTENFKLTCLFQDYLFKQTKNGETPQRFRQGGKKNGSVYLVFSNKQRMERLLNVLDREGKRMVQSIGQSGIFYQAFLEYLKRVYGNPTFFHI